MPQSTDVSQIDLFIGHNVTTSDLLTVLHVSDFHFHTRRRKEQEIVIEALLEDVRSLCIGHRKPDLIVFSGDLTQAPPTDTHAEAYDILLEPLQKAANISSERMFIVAGNHDVDRVAVSRHQAQHQNWRETSNSMEMMNQAYLEDAFSDAYFDKFANYLDLEDYMSKGTKVYGNIFCSVYYIDALNTDLVIFNSSMLSTGGLPGTGRDEGLLMIPEYAIRDAIAKLTPGSFRIFTTHHPLNAFTETGASYLSKEIQKHANLHLFGHMHDPSGAQIIGFNGSVVSNQAGAVFTQRREYYIGYSLICIDKTKGFVQTLVRSYFPERGIFNDGVDRIDEGRFYNSPEARQYWRSLANPVDEAKFKAQLAGQVRDDLVKEWDDLGLLDNGGRQHFVAPRLNKIDIDSNRDNKIKLDAPLPFQSLSTGQANIILYSPQEYGRTTILREVQYEYLAGAAELAQPRLPIMIRFEEIAQNLHHMTRVVRSRSLIDTKAFDTDVLLKLGMMCLLVDDVEFADKKRMAILRAFISQYPQCRYIFTSLKNSAAPYGAHVVTETPVRFEFVELCELKRKEMRELVKMKVPDAGDVEIILDRLHSEISEINLPFTAANGTILITIYEQNSNFQPINRSVVIEQFIDATLRKSSIEQVRRETFDYSNKTSLLAHLAGWMATNNCYTPTYESLRSEMRSYVDNLGLEVPLDDLLAEFFAARIMRKLPENCVSFRYRAVLEYFIATQMIKSTVFKNWVLQEDRYLTYINELHYYAGLVRNDADLMNVVAMRFEGIIAEMEKESSINPDQIATIELPRTAGSDALDHMSAHLLGQPLSKEERDEALEGEIPRDVEERQNVFRPRIEHTGHKLLVGLFLFSGLVKNMEQINKNEKQRLLKLAWRGWSLLLSSSLAIVSELAKQRQMRINGVLYEIFAPKAMSDEDLGRKIALNMPTAITKFIATSLGTEKLQRQLTEPDLEEADEPLVYEFFRSSLIADLRLPATPNAIRNAFKKLHGSSFLSEALVWKIANMRRMDEINQSHFEAVQSDVAGMIARLGGGKPSELAKDKTRQIEKFRKEGLLLKMQRQKEDK
ncbi:Calcineurin-like phosphoesterase [Ensifer sp. YR511]|nr:Calcineurin-like phosphoesterase [Ensifer sp. YR511]